MLTYAHFARLCVHYLCTAVSSTACRRYGRHYKSSAFTGSIVFFGSINYFTLFIDHIFKIPHDGRKLTYRNFSRSIYQRIMSKTCGNGSRNVCCFRICDKDIAVHLTYRRILIIARRTYIPNQIARFKVHFSRHPRSRQTEIGTFAEVQ